MDVKGKSVNQLLNMDYDVFDGLSRQELAQVVSRLASAANKRVRTFEKHDAESPALRQAARGGKFSVAGKDLNALRSEYMRAKSFMQTQTGSYRGFEKVKSETVNTLWEQGIIVDKSQIDKFWRSYEELKKRNPAVSSKQLKYAVLREIADTIEENNEDISLDEIVDQINEELEEIYEREVGSDDGRVSGFFTIE